MDALPLQSITLSRDTRFEENSEKEGDSSISIRCHAQLNAFHCQYHAHTQPTAGTNIQRKWKLILQTLRMQLPIKYTQKPRRNVLQLISTFLTVSCWLSY